MAYGSRKTIKRREMLQLFLCGWFLEPEGWMDNRIHQHRAIRVDLSKLFYAVDGLSIRISNPGRCLFPAFQSLTFPMEIS
nr:hypothetical protein [uncultured Cohaesibacter sp.]